MIVPAFVFWVSTLGETRRNTLLFLDRVTEEMPFPIQRIQTDRGTEFFAESVQRRLMAAFIKFRPIPPRSPHLNGKVERSQLTDLVDSGPDIRRERKQFNSASKNGNSSTTTDVSHGGLAGKTPQAKLLRLASAPRCRKSS